VDRQYRHPISVITTEICAGCVEPDEDALTAAKRELLEETGYSGGIWTQLMVTAPNAGAMGNYCYSFLAEGVEKTDVQHIDATANIRVLLFSTQEVFRMLQNGEFKQAMIIAPLWKYFALHPLS